MDWPVERGRVYKKFGTSQHPTLPNITTYNSGVEIETASGSVARAAFKGTVQQIQLIRGGGYTVLIRHGNYLTVYQNLKNLKVNVNDKVSTKQVLGEIAENSFSGKTILKFTESIKYHLKYKLKSFPNYGAFEKHCIPTLRSEKF